MPAEHQAGPALKSTISVSIPVNLKQQARERGIGFSATLIEALTAKLADPERS